MYWPGGRRSGSYPASATFRSALERNMLPRLVAVTTVTHRAAQRPRAYVRVKGPDAEEFLQRMLSNDVTGGDVFDALLLTAKARLIAPLRVWRRESDDFLLLTEPELGEAGRTARHRRGARRGGRADARRCRPGTRSNRGRHPRLGQGARRDDSPRRGGARRDAHLVHEGLLPRSGADRAAPPPRSCQSAAAHHRGGVGSGRR